MTNQIERPQGRPLQVEPPDFVGERDHGHGSRPTKRDHVVASDHRRFQKMTPDETGATRDEKLHATMLTVADTDKIRGLSRNHASIQRAHCLEILGPSKSIARIDRDRGMAG